MQAAADEVEQIVRAALAGVRPGAAGLHPDADLAAEAGLDSVEVMDLVMAIEDKLDLSIPVETLSQAHTIRGLCAGILGLTRSRAS
jgi:acyl carrier protein